MLIPSLLQKSISAYMSEHKETPVIIFNDELLSYNFNYLCKSLLFSPSDLYYSIKSNYCPEIIQTLNAKQSGFEIGSQGELEIIKSHEIAPERVIYSNPVKIPSHIANAHSYGINTFAFDNENELNKLAEFAPQCKVFVRLSIDNEGASWKLTGKFGASGEQVVPLFKKAKSLGLSPSGITMHVGWNNNDKKTWENTLRKVDKIINDCFSNKIELDFFDIGGGFPAHLNNQYKNLDEIIEKISPSIAKFKQKYNLRIIAEPGSFLVANTAAMLVKIFDIIHKNGKRWIFIDSGINQGFYWIYTGLKYAISIPDNNIDTSQLSECIITGPSCDTHDIFSSDIKLPVNLKVGDYLIVFPAGAYINSSVSYNGFSTPPLISK